MRCGCTISHCMRGGMVGYGLNPSFTAAALFCRRLSGQRASIAVSPAVRFIRDHYRFRLSFAV